MSRFEVFIPATPPQLPVDVTLRVQSENWLAALKTGLQKMGGAQLPPNILCDIQADGSIHVSDPSGRAFRIREMVEEPATTPAPSPAPPVAAPAPAPRAAAATPPPGRSPPPAPRTMTLPQDAAAPRAAPPPAVPRTTPVPATPKIIRPATPSAPKSAVRPAQPRPSSVPDRVEEMKAPAPRPRLLARSAPELKAEEVLSELFHQVADLGSKRSRQEGLSFLLDLAMEKIGCEAGSVFLSQPGVSELGFAVTRGPKAEEIRRLGLTVPVGVGIVGFCAQEDVCLAVSDVQKDSRWYRRVSEAIGYATSSLLCAPISSAGRVLGALEVLNKSGKDPFDSSDLAVLSYLAHQAAEFLLRVEA